MRLLAVRTAEELSIKGRATVTIKLGNGVIIERPIRDIDAILIIGSHVNIKSSLPPVLSAYNIPLAIIAKDNVAILTNPIKTRYNNYRRLQYQLQKHEALTIALEYIKSKINGMKNILKYHKITPPNTPDPPTQEDNPEEYEQKIRTWESTSSHTYWKHIIKLINKDKLKTLEDKYNFTGRKPQHPDPFNKTLSLMYSILYTLSTKALIAAGLDPTHGFLHKTRYSTPLTFDYTEMLKPIAIHATIDFINNQELPELDQDNELPRNAINTIIKTLYKYLTMKHKHTNKTPYQYIYIKSFCLAKHLEGKCPRNKITITWNRAEYKAPTPQTI